MKLFLTGASGFVGAETLRLAVAAGHDVAAPVRPGNPALRLAPLAGKYRKIDLDLRDAPGVAAAVRANQPDVVIHLAWTGVANAARFDASQVSDNIDAACALTQAAAQAAIASHSAPAGEAQP